MSQVFQAGAGGFKAWFTLYDTDEKPQGELQIIFCPPGAYCSAIECRGISLINEEHKKYLSSKNTKKTMANVGMGAAIVGGVGLLGGLLFNESSKRDEEEREKEERYREEEERLEQERRRVDEERRELQEEQERREREERERERQRYEQPSYYARQDPEPLYQSNNYAPPTAYAQPNYGGCGQWDPIGTYTAGQRVQYNGRSWECLQGHTSNPTWQPGAAHSLWRAC
jgi:hypothetical protein